MKKFLLLTLLLGSVGSIIRAQENALHFDGVDDYITIDNADFATGTDYTIEGWFRSPDLGTTRTIFSGKELDNDDVLMVEISNSGRMRYLHRVPGGSSGGVNLYSSTLVDDNVWHHFAAVKETGNGFRLYVDGKLEASSNASAPDVPTELQLTIGVLVIAPFSRLYQGELDELRLWSHALTLSEINESMNNEVESGQNGLAAHYTFDQGVAGGDNDSGCPGGSPCENTLTEATGNAQNGTLNNFALSGNTSNFVPGVSLEAPFEAVESSNSLRFDGINDYAVAYDMSFTNRSDYTLEGWFNLTDVSREQTLLAGLNGSNLHYFLLEVINGTLRYVHRSPADARGGVEVFTPVSSPLSANTWHHFAAMRGADNKLRVYLDGNLVITSTANAPDITANLTLAVGSLTQDGNSRFTGGFIDDIRLWSKARTESEIQADMNRELSGNEPDLAAYYSFNEGNPDGDNGSNCPDTAPCRRHVLDGTPNHRTLRLQNFALSGTTSNFAANSVLLPVEFSFFTAANDKEGTILNWETAREESNAGFEIQRSVTGEAWEYIGYLPGAGDSESATRYRYVDEGSSPGTTFYRLKQLDYDGHYAYSSVVSVVAGGPESRSVRFYPNPTSGLLHTLSDGDYRITDLVGKAVRRGTVRNRTIDLGELPRGTYLLTVKTPDGTHTGTVVKD